MIFFPTQFKEEYPGIVENVRCMANKKFNTKYLMNTIMDMAGYDICDSTIYVNSLFKGKFSEVSKVLK